MEQTFADGIGRITVIGGIVRLDLITYSPSEMDANGQPRAVLSQRVCMSVDAFLRSSEKVIEAVQVISRANLRPNDQRQAEQPQAAAPQQPQQQRPEEPPAVSATPPAPTPPRRLFP